MSEIYKSSVHSGKPPRLFHYREARGLEIDLLIEQDAQFDAVEIKSAATTTMDFFKNLKRFGHRMKDKGGHRSLRNFVVYGGHDSQQRSDARVLSWHDLHRLIVG